MTLGRHVRILTQREESEGLAVDVDENGARVLELADRSQKKIVYGYCCLIWMHQTNFECWYLLRCWLP